MAYYPFYMYYGAGILRKFNNDFSLDTSFGDNGVLDIGDVCSAGYIQDIATDADGYLYVATSSDDLVVKLNPDGTLVWTYSEHTDGLRAIAVDTDGNVYSGGLDYTIHKIDSDGNNIWNNTDPSKTILCLAVDTEGYVYAGLSDYVYKISPAGTTEWSKQPRDTVNGVSVDSDFVYFCYANDDAARKYAKDGTYQWANTSFSYDGVAIEVSPDARVFVVLDYGYVYELDSTDGSVVWSKDVGTDYTSDLGIDDELNLYIPDSYNGLYILDSDGNNKEFFTDSDYHGWGIAVSPGKYGAGFWGSDADYSEEVGPIVSTEKLKMDYRIGRYHEDVIVTTYGTDALKMHLDSEGKEISELSVYPDYVKNGYLYSVIDKFSPFTKFDYNGNVIWECDDVTIASPYFLHVNDSGIVHFGLSEGYYKIDSDGSLLWSDLTLFDSPPQGFDLDTQENTYCTDQTAIKKFDSDGALLWQDTNYGSGTERETTKRVVVDERNDCVYVTTQKQNDSGYLVKYDLSGTEQWAVLFSHWLLSITVDNSGNVYAGDNLGYLIKIDPSDGSEILKRDFDDDSLPVLVVDDEYYIYAAALGSDTFLKISSKFKKLWEHPGNGQNVQGLFLLGVHPMPTQHFSTSESVNKMNPVRVAPDPFTDITISTKEFISAAPSEGSTYVFYYKVDLVFYKTTHDFVNLKVLDLEQVISGLNSNSTIYQCVVDSDENLYVLWNSRQTITKLTIDGEILWKYEIDVGEIEHIELSTDEMHLFYCINYQKKIVKIRVDIGEEIQDGNWPVYIEDSGFIYFVTICVSGDFLYAAKNSDNADNEGMVYKLRQDTGYILWSFQLSQDSSYGNSINDIHVNDAGYVGIASIKLMQNGTGVTLLSPSGSAIFQRDASEPVNTIKVDSNNYVYFTRNGGSEDKGMWKWDSTDNEETGMVWYTEFTTYYDPLRSFINEDIEFVYVLGRLISILDGSIHKTLSTGTILDVNTNPYPAWSVAITTTGNGDVLSFNDDILSDEVVYVLSNLPCSFVIEPDADHSVGSVEKNGENIRDYVDEDNILTIPTISNQTELDVSFVFGTVVVSERFQVTETLQMDNTHPSKTYYTLTPEYSGNGKIIPSVPTMIEQGSSLSVKIQPAIGNKVSSLSVNGITQQNKRQYSVDSVSEDISISAEFSSLPTKHSASYFYADSVSPISELFFAKWAIDSDEDVTSGNWPLLVSSSSDNVTVVDTKVRDSFLYLLCAVGSDTVVGKYSFAGAEEWEVTYADFTANSFCVNSVGEVLIGGENAIIEKISATGTKETVGTIDIISDMSNSIISLMVDRYDYAYVQFSHKLIKYDSDWSVVWTFETGDSSSYPMKYEMTTMVLDQYSRSVIGTTSGDLIFLSVKGKRRYMKEVSVDSVLSIALSREILYVSTADNLYKFCMRSAVSNVSDSIYAIADDIISLTNDERIINDVDPLSFSFLLEEAAIRHSKDMRDNENLSHDGSDGTDVLDRVFDTGYLFEVTEYSVGENIASCTGTSEDCNAENFVNQWINSSAHYSNMMDSNFSEIGVAVKEVNGTYYATQVFGDRNFSETIRNFFPSEDEWVLDRESHFGVSDNSNFGFALSVDQANNVFVSPGIMCDAGGNIVCVVRR